MLDRLAPPIEDVRSGIKPFSHAFEHGFAFPSIDAPPRARCTLRLEGTGPADPHIGVTDGDMPVLLRAGIGIETLTTGADVTILLGIVSKFVLGEIAFVDGGTRLEEHTSELQSLMRIS